LTKQLNRLEKIPNLVDNTLLDDILALRVEVNRHIDTILKTIKYGLHIILDENNNIQLIRVIQYN